MACLYCTWRTKRIGKCPFHFLSPLDIYVSNINVFISASCFTGKHNKQQMNHFHPEPQICSSLILSCSEPGTSGPFWRWIGTVFEELSQTWKWIYNREAAVWSRGLWCHVECHMVINKFKWQKCLPSQRSRGCLRDIVSQWGLRGGELAA